MTGFFIVIPPYVFPQYFTSLNKTIYILLDNHNSLKRNDAQNHKITQNIVIKIPAQPQSLDISCAFKAYQIPTV
ncbi:hypothetical protein GCM10027286_12550 [Virgibacillus ainsalahensis]